MSSRFFGGILLVAGTAIGAGMLALPVISSFAGFVPSFLALIGCWIFMFATAWLILEVNLASPGDANLISMAGRTLGVFGKALCWVTYLLLLYSLTAAYIAGSSPLFLKAINWLFEVDAPSWVGPFPLLVLFGLFVYLGTRSVDYVNRLLMAGLVIAYFGLVLFLPPHVQSGFISHIDYPVVWLAVPVMITSFGFHIIIPTLSTYLRHDKRELRLAILIGSLVPLLVYVVWDFLVLGTVPLVGEPSLAAAWAQGNSSTAPLTALLGNRWIATFAGVFSFFAIITSFLGVSLSLSDFLRDGLKMDRSKWGREVACLVTFIPPLLFVLLYQRGFLLALQYAGIFVLILLGILPALMAWQLPHYRTTLKRGFLCLILFASFFVICLDILERAGYWKKAISAYVHT